MCQQSNMRMEMSNVKWKRIEMDAMQKRKEFKCVKCNESVWGIIQSNCDENSKSVLKRGKKTSMKYVRYFEMRHAYVGIMIQNCDEKSNVQNVLIFDANWNGESENEIMFLTLKNDLKNMGRIGIALSGI